MAQFDYFACPLGFPFGFMLKVNHSLVEQPVGVGSFADWNDDARPPIGHKLEFAQAQVSPSLFLIAADRLALCHLPYALSFPGSVGLVDSQ
jgi:hypothetical protein